MTCADSRATRESINLNVEFQSQPANGWSKAVHGSSPSPNEFNGSPSGFVNVTKEAVGESPSLNQRQVHPDPYIDEELHAKCSNDLTSMGLTMEVSPKIKCMQVSSFSYCISALLTCFYLLVCFYF